MNIYQLNPSNNFLWANHIKSDTPKQQKSCSESWSPQKKNNSQVEKKDLGHKCFECKETFKSFGTPKLGLNPNAGEKWPGWCGGLLLVVWLFARQRLVNLIELKDIESDSADMVIPLPKKIPRASELEPQRWKRCPCFPTLWAFTVMNHVVSMLQIPKSV